MQYDTILSEMLLEFFKRLDCKERVRARVVCKEWRNIIDQNRSLWRSLDFDVDVNDEAEPKALVLFDEKSQSTLQDVSVQITQVTNDKTLDTLFGTLRKSNRTLQSVKLKTENVYRVETRALEVLLDCPNLVTFMLWDPALFRSVVDLQKKVWDKDSIVEKSKLHILWMSLPSNPFSTHPTLLENLVSLAVDWYLSPSKWREVLQASARNFKHLKISIALVSGEQSVIPILSFPNLKVLEVQYYDKFPDWMIFPSTTIVVLWACDILENLPSVNELWISRLHQGLRLGKCCPLLVELRIPRKDLAIEWHRDAVLGLLQERKKQVAIGFEVAGVKMIPLKRIVLSFSNDNGGFLDEVRELVEEVVDLAEVPNKIPLYI